MSLKGNLAVVNLADVFQMLSRGKSSGLLRVQAPEGTRYIELQNGLISLAGRATEYIQLGDLLIARKAINDENLSTAMKIHKENGMGLGQVLLEMNYVSRESLDESLQFLIEEEVCDLFTLREGDFDFLANATLDTKIAPGGGAVHLEIVPDNLLLEAARRADEWHELEKRITSQSLLFCLTEEGQRVYQDANGISDEGRVIMRLMRSNNTIEGVVQKSCLGRLNANRMVLELWDAQLIEPVPKSEYLHYAKLQMDAGQIADAHRIAVQLSKVGSPETIKLAIPWVENLSKQLALDTKQLRAVTQTAEKKAGSTNKKGPGANLILSKSRVSGMTIAIAVAVLLLILGGGYYYYTTRGVDPRITAVERLDKLREESFKLISDRKFLDAIQRAGTFNPPDPELKSKHEKLKADVQIEIDTQFTRDFSPLARENATGFTATELNQFEKNYKDYDGVIIESSVLVKDKNSKKLLKKIQLLKENLFTTQFKQRLEDLRKNTQELNAEQLLKGYEDLIKDAPPERIAKDARADYFKLRAPGIEARRQLSLAREMLDKGGFEVARKYCETIKAAYPGTKLAADADKILADLADRENKAADELSKIGKLILQRKADDALTLANQLLATKPPAAIQSALIVEMRKLQADVPEAQLQKTITIASRLWDTDPKLARSKILEVVNAFPFSEAAANVQLRVQISSSPEGATVTNGDRVLGKTPLVAELPVTGPLLLNFSLAGFEPFDLIENNFRGERIQATFTRKPQTVVLTPVTATAGMLALNDLLLLAGGNELVVCSSKTLEVLRRVNLESMPLPVKTSGKPVQPPALNKNELKLRAFSANAEDAESWAFVSCTGSYFFQVPTNDIQFHRIACEPGAIGPPQMYRPQRAGAIRLISIVTKSGIDVFSSERQAIAHKDIPAGGNVDQPVGYAFDGNTYYIPRDNNIVYAVDGYRGDLKWTKQLDSRISMPPATHQLNKLLAAADIKGRIVIVDLDTGKEKGHSELGVSSSLGLAQSSVGFVAALEDNSLVLVPLAGGPPVWTTPLPGKTLFTPLIRNPEKVDKYTLPMAIVCSEMQDSSFIVTAINLMDGSLSWRARLISKPISGTVSNDAVYIGTVDNELVKFDFAMPISLK